ncbi:MAG TPA: 4Fe-4S binding protein [Sunxiuqinia sp.]|nr:4Fe-4S binding protein [Sunxiuqinia sp.]
MIADTCILFCRCGAGIIPDARLDQLAQTFQTLKADVIELRDLCALSVHEADVLQEIGDSYARKVFVACYPRAVKNMLRQAGVDFGDFEVLNFKELSADNILSKLKEGYNLPEGETQYSIQASQLDVPAWFPVIDESRCTFCGKCARFCLFGVYSFNKKSLKVVDPLACKNSCPACGRTCPTSAIMFPRLAENTVLAGAEPLAKNCSRPGNDGSLFVMLNERNQQRKNIFKPNVMQVAEDERRKALEEFKNSIRKTD